MILFFDTETTGLYDNRLPFDHEAQPHLVQIAAIMSDDEGKSLSEYSLIVNPRVKIPDRAMAVHGITDSLALSAGIEEQTALGLFDFMARRASLIVAHNIKFDINVMRCIYAREKNMTELECPLFCTMEAASPIINLPPTDRMKAAGFNKPKPPRLEECIKHFFDEDLIGAHDALIDVRACARVFFHLKSIGDAT